jgi:CHAT domain-containing protein
VHARLHDLLVAGGEADRSAVLAREPALDLHAAMPELVAIVSNAAFSNMSARDGETYPAGLRFLLARASADHDTALQAWYLTLLCMVMPPATTPLERAAADSVAMQAARAAGEEDALAWAEHWKALHLHYIDAAQAIELEQTAAARLERLDDPRIALRAQANFSLWQARAGNWREATSAAEALARDARRFGYRRGEAFAAIRRADILQGLGRTDEAAEPLRTAIEMLLQAGYASDAAMDLGDLAAIDYAGGRFSLGRAEHARALVLAGDRVHPWYFQQYVLAGPIEALLSAGHVAEAARLLPESIVAPGIAVATAEVRLAQGRATEALAALAGLPAADDPQIIWRSRLVAARADRRLGHPREAEAELRAAIAFLEARRAALAADDATRAVFLDDKLSAFRELVDLLVAQGRTRDAFAALERMRAQSLEDVLAQGRVDAGAALTVDEATRQHALDARLNEVNRDLLRASQPDAKLHAELERARRDLETFDAQLYLMHPGLSRSGIAVADPLAEAAAALPIGAHALEYVVLDRSTVLFVIRRDEHDLSIAARRIPLTRSELEQQVDAFARALAERDPAAARAARRLYDLVLAPAGSAASTSATLCVVPDGPLWRLPFPVLRDAEGRELITRQAIFRASSLSVLAQERRHGASASVAGVLAMGNPTIGDDTTRRVRSLERDAELGSLPDAEREVTTIGSLYGTGAEVRVGSAASERAFKQEAERFDIVHLATHALIDDGAPLYSALVLAAAPGDGEDGLLEMREIARLHLHARLAVLSACETARGRISSGAGILGLSWALMSAGVPTAVTADWKVDSAATERLMTEFHRWLLAGDNIATALRRAQLAVRDDADGGRSHPYYWAAFGVVGDGWASLRSDGLSATAPLPARSH